MEKNPQNDLVYPGERVDDLQNGLYVIQNPEKFCFGMDARRNGSGRGNPEQTPGRLRCVKKPANR